MQKPHTHFLLFKVKTRAVQDLFAKTAHKTCPRPLVAPWRSLQQIRKISFTWILSFFRKFSFSRAFFSLRSRVASLNAPPRLSLRSSVASLRPPGRFAPGWLRYQAISRTLGNSFFSA